MGAILTHSRMAVQNGWLPQAELAWNICSSPYMQTVLGICAHRLLALDVLVPLSLVLDHDGIPTTHGDAQKQGNDSRSVPRRRKKRNGLLEDPKGCSMLSRERSTTVQRCPCFRGTFLVPILYAQNGDNLVHSSRGFIKTTTFEVSRELTGLVPAHRPIPLTFYQRGLV